MKFQLNMYMILGESNQRAPSLLNTYAFTYIPAAVERVSRHVLHVIVREMECNTGLGLWVWVAAFSVTRSRS